MTHHIAIVLFLLCSWASAASADLYMTPQGAGTADGSSWENALSYNAAPNSLESAWSRLPPGATCHLGAGDYEARPFVLTADGRDEASRRTLRGEIRDGRRAVFTGTWGRNDQNAGFTLITIASGAQWWAIEGLAVRNCRGAIDTQAPGRVAHGRIADLVLEGLRDAIVIDGGATATQPELGSHDIVISDCSVVHYTKRGYRFRDGCYDIRLERCLADAGGKEWATEAFHMGFNVNGGAVDSGVADHDLTFIDCVARNNYWDAGEDKYWQGDGFCAEARTYNLTFIGCEAYDNGDGGWDVKTANPLLIGCVSLRNKKNYRFWSDDPGALLIRCLGAYAIKRGGNSEATGIWVGGRIRAMQCTFIENDASIDLNDHQVTPERKARMGVDLQACLVTLDEDQQRNLQAFPGTVIADSVIWRPHGQAGEAPGFRADEAARQLAQAGTAFDSATQGPAKGYHSSWRREDLLAAARARQPLLKSEGRLLPAKPIVLYQGKRPDGWYVGGWKGAVMAEVKGGGREGRTALAVTATGAGGAAYQTKNPGAVINLADRESAAWELCLDLAAPAEALTGLRIRAIILDPAEATKEIALRARPGEAGWSEVRLPLAEFAVDAQKPIRSFAGFAIRVDGRLAAPLVIDQVRLEPVR